MVATDDDGLTSGDLNALKWHEEQLEAAKATNNHDAIRRNQVHIARIRKHAKDRQAEGIQDGDADGYVEVRGGTGCLSLVLLRLPLLLVVLVARSVSAPMIKALRESWRWGRILRQVDGSTTLRERLAFYRAEREGNAHMRRVYKARIAAGEKLTPCGGSR